MARSNFVSLCACILCLCGGVTSLESSGFRHSLHADAIAQAAEVRDHLVCGGQSATISCPAGEAVHLIHAGLVHDESCNSSSDSSCEIDLTTDLQSGFFRVQAATVSVQTNDAETTVQVQGTIMADPGEQVRSLSVGKGRNCNGLGTQRADADISLKYFCARTVRRKFNLFDRRRTPFEFGCGSGENVLVVMAQFGIDAATRDVMAIHQALQATQHNMLQNIRSPFSSASSSFPASTNGPDTSVNVTETCHPEVRGNEVQKLEHLCKHQRTCTITNETDLILGLTCQLPEGIFWIEYLCIPEGTLFGSRGALRDAMLEPTLRTVWTWGRIGASCQEVCGALYLSHCSEYALALGVTTLELLHAIRLAANLNAAYFGGTSQVCAVAHAEGGLWDPASAGGRCSFTSWSGQQSEGAARCEAASAGRSRLCPCVVDVGATRPQVEFHYPDVVAGTVVDQFIIGNVSLSTYADVPETSSTYECPNPPGEAPSLRFVSVRFTSIQASEETRRAIDAARREQQNAIDSDSSIPARQEDSHGVYRYPVQMDTEEARTDCYNECVRMGTAGCKAFEYMDRLKICVLHAVDTLSVGEVYEDSLMCVRDMKYQQEIYLVSDSKWRDQDLSQTTGHLMQACNPNFSCNSEFLTCRHVPTSGRHICVPCGFPFEWACGGTTCHAGELESGYCGPVTSPVA